MSKNYVDPIWVQDQLNDANVPDTTKNVVKDMLELGWDDLEVPEDANLPEIMEVFSTLAQGHGLRKLETEEAWLPVERGFVHVGDVIRVKHNAFDGKSGLYHNGRVGKVVAVRSGDIVFRSTDTKSPNIDGARYSPEQLERRVIK